MVKIFFGWGVGSVCGFIKLVSSNATGSSGGIFPLCDARKRSLKNHWVGDFSVSVLFEVLENHREGLISSVYGPNDN